MCIRNKSPLLLISIILTVLLLPLSSTYGAGKPPRKLLMGVLGDSITAATLADLPIPYAETPEEQVQKWADQGVQANFLFENKWALSWASGRKVDSHFKKLDYWLRSHGEARELEVLNVAYPGDTSYEMEGQAQQIVDVWSAGDYDAIKYVTILIGSNDACSKKSPVGTPLAEMKANLIRTFKILATIKQEEPLRVLLVGIPRIPDLGTPEFRRGKTLFGLSCETVRNKILNFCNPLLLWQNQDQYGEKMQVVEDKNRLLRMIVNEANTLFPNLEVVYSNRLYNLEIPLEVLAADCFHPGKSAQGKISDQTWLDQPWFN